jgi:hypothetical protein
MNESSNHKSQRLHEFKLWDGCRLTFYYEKVGVNEDNEEKEAAYS